jgi:hypothetical protein
MTIIFKIPNPKFFTVCKRFSSIDIFLLETGCLVAVMGYRAGVSEGKGGGSRHKTDLYPLPRCNLQRRRSPPFIESTDHIIFSSNASESVLLASLSLSSESRSLSRTHPYLSSARISLPRDGSTRPSLPLFSSASDSFDSQAQRISSSFSCRFVST